METSVRKFRVGGVTTSDRNLKSINLANLKEELDFQLQKTWPWSWVRLFLWQFFGLGVVGYQTNFNRKATNWTKKKDFFFSCIAGRVRDIVGQLLEFWLKELITAEIPWKQANNQTKTQPKQHKHQTTAPQPGKFAKLGETRWDTTRPSQPLIGSLPPCSNPPRRPLFRCQPYLHLHLHPQAGLERQASVDVAWVDKCPLESATFLHNAP